MLQFGYAYNKIQIIYTKGIDGLTKRKTAVRPENPANGVIPHCEMEFVLLF